MQANSPELVRDLTKILGKKLRLGAQSVEKFFLNLFSHPRVSFFFTRIGSRPYQNFGKKKFEKKIFEKKFLKTFFSHPRVSFFFTPIGSRPYQNFGKKKN